MFLKCTRVLAFCVVSTIFSATAEAQESVVFYFRGSIAPCSGSTGVSNYSVTVGGLQGSQIDQYLQPGTGWELSAIRLPETTGGHDLVRLYQNNFYELPRLRLFHGAGSLPIPDGDGTVVAFELTYNQSLFSSYRSQQLSQLQQNPSTPKGLLAVLPAGSGKQVPSRERNRSSQIRALGRNLFSALYTSGGGGSFGSQGQLTAYGLSDINRVSACTHPPLSNLTRIAVIGGTVGDPNAQSSVDIIRNKTVTVPLTQAQASDIKNGVSKLIMGAANSPWVDIPQVDPVLFYANGAPRVVKLTFTDEVLGYGLNPYNEKFVYIGPASQIHGRDALGLSNQLQYLLTQTPEFTLEAEGPRTGESYRSRINIANIMPKEVVSFGSHNGTFRYAANLLPSGTISNHLPQAGQAQLIMSADFGELSHLKLSLAFVNSIATDNGLGYDDLYLKSLRLCAKNATSFAAWNPFIETLNRNLYQYGTPVQVGDKLCLPLIPETGIAHLFQAGQVTPFIDITVSFDALSARAGHLASGNPRYVTLNTTGSENSFYSLPYLYNSGIPSASLAGKTPAQVDYEASRAYYHIRPWVNQQTGECVGGVCNINPQFYSVLSGPPGGNTTGGGDIDFAKADSAVLHNARGSSHIAKAIDALTIHAISQLQREFADGLVTPTGEINTLDRMRATYAHFKYDVAPIVHSASSWHPRFNGSRPNQSVQSVYLAHRAAGQAIAPPYQQAFLSFGSHNNQHIVRMVPDILAVGLSTGDPIIMFYNQALGETVLTAHYWHPSWYPTGSFRLERNEVVSSPGRGTSFGRNMEVLPLIAEAAARYPQIPARFIDEFTTPFSEVMDYAPTIAGLLGEATMLAPQTGTTAERDAFRLTMSQRCGFPFANTEITDGMYVWQQLLMTLSAAHVVDRFKGHTSSAVQGQVQTIETALINGLLAQHDPSVGYKNGMPIWVLPVAVRNTLTNQSCTATPAEQHLHGMMYSPIDLYWKQTIAPFLVNNPQTQSAILPRIFSDMVRGATYNLDSPSSLIGSWAGQRIGRM